jgi:SAM-dependent methyltransferase
MPDAPPSAATRPARSGDRPPTREDVRAAYRMILGREPEDEAVLDRHLAQAPTIQALRRRFLSSDEFLGRAGGTPPRPIPLVPDRLPVEDATAEDEAGAERLAALLRRVGAYWARIGAEQPHWSVLTQEQFRPDRIAENEDAFYASGGFDLDLVRRALLRHGMDPARLPRCVEFGCGVGRATLGLATLFAEVVGCDISAPHLDLARQAAARRGIGNIGWHHSSMAAPMPGGGWDIWYSRIVLQHNPPPVMGHLLRLAFAGLRPGGAAIFQLPVHNAAYHFDIDEHLADPRPPIMEMHLLPQHRVFALAREAGLEVLDVREDAQSVPASWLSNLFVLRRPFGAARGA